MKVYALAGASFYQGKTITLIAGHCAGKEIETIVGQLFKIDAAAVNQLKEILK